jgi:hypothetical protein
LPCCRLRCRHSPLHNHLQPHSLRRLLCHHPAESVFAADELWSHKGYKAPAFNYIAMDVSRDWHAIKEAKSKGLTELPRPRPHPPVVFLHIICKDKVVKPYERRKRRAKLHRQLPQTQVALGRSHGDNTAITGRSQSHGDHTEITAVSVSPITAPTSHTHT